MNQKREFAQWGKEAPEYSNGCPCKEGKDRRASRLAANETAPVKKSNGEMAFATGGGILIEKDIPIPTFRIKKKYPWDKMNVGDSFFVKGPRKTTLYLSAKKAGIKSCIRPEGEGFRVWRKE
jgi:hypothetical protein